MALNKFSNIAKTMAPGTFAILNNGSDASGYSTTFTASGVATFNSYSYKATYDPLWRRVFILGDGGHIALTDTVKFVCYELDYDRWSILPNSTPTSSGNMHIYGLQTHVSRPGNNTFFRIPGNNYNTFTYNTDFYDVQNVAFIGKNVYPAPGPPDTDAGGRGNLEYFPERDELLYHFSYGGGIKKKAYASGGWSDLVTVASPEGQAIKHDQVAMLYHPVAKCIIWGGGADFNGSPPPDWLVNARWWRYDVDGGIHELDEFHPENFGAYVPPGYPGFIQFGNDGGALLVADPGSKKYVIIKNEGPTVSMFQLDPFAAPGSQWSRLSTAIEASWPGDVYNCRTDNITAIAIPEYNVIFFCAFNKTWLYKHSAPLPFSQKKLAHGVISSKPLSSPSELLYTWDGWDGTRPLDVEMASRGVGIGYDFPYPFSLDRGPGEGNTKCSAVPTTGELMIPDISGGGLNIKIPGRVGDQSTSFNMNIDDTLHSSPAANALINGDPANPLGRRLYIQLQMKADAAFWANQYWKSSFTWIDTVSSAGFSCAANNPDITIPAGASDQMFTAAMQGLQVAITGGSGGLVNTYGFFTINQFLSPTSVRLDRPPAPGASGSSGRFEVAGIGAIVQTGGGPKLIIITGDPPDYGGGTSLVVTLKNHPTFLSNSYFNGPSMIGIQGHDSPSQENSTVVWNQTDWNELTIMIDVGPAGNDTIGDSTMALWVNGQRDDPGTNWRPEPGHWGAIVDWAPGLGFGWIQIAPQITHKDPCQNLPEANIWYKEIIVSTKPIQLGITTAVEPPVVTPGAPALPWFLRT